MFKVWTNGYYKEYEVLKETKHQIVYYKYGNNNPSFREVKFGNNYRWLPTEDECISFLIEHYERNIRLYYFKINRTNEDILDTISKINNLKNKLSKI